MRDLPPYSPIFQRATIRNLVIPYILFYLSLPSTWPIFLRVWIYFITPLALYSAHVYLRTAYFRYRARSLSAFMIPFVEPASKPRSSTWLDRLARIGNVDLMLAWEREGKEGYLGEGMVRQALEGAGGTVNTKILGEDSMITSNPDHIHQILSGSFESFPKGAKFMERAKGLFGPRGVFVGDGANWKFHRSFTRPFFSRTNSAAFDPIATLEPHTAKLIDLIMGTQGTTGKVFRSPREPADSPLNGQGGSVDVQALFLTYTLDVASEFLFGHCVGGLDRLAGKTCGNRLADETGQNEVTRDLMGSHGEHVTGEELTMAFAEAQAVLSRRIKMGTPWALFELGGNKMTRPMETVKGFIRPLVDRAYQRRVDARGLAETQRKGTLLDHLIDSLGGRAAIEDELINILVAARDTTASALSFCVYCLTLYPDIMEKLRSEIRQSTRRQDWNYSALKDLRYMDFFVQEVLRLYPPVPMNIRRSSTEVVLKGSPDFYMPAHTSIILATLLMQRSKAIWGEDAEEFRPERWDSSANEAGERVSTRGSVPFSTGPRTCLGQNFALMQIKYVLVKILEASEGATQGIVLAPATPPPEAWSALAGRGRDERVWVSSNLTLQVKGGLWIRVTGA